MSKRELLLQQIKSIRRLGNVNMCDADGVFQFAKKLKFKELMEFVQTDNYVGFIFTGNEDLLPDD